MPNKCTGFSGSDSRQREGQLRAVVRARCFSMHRRLRHRWQLLSSRCSFRVTRTMRLSPKAATAGSWRDSDGHPQAPRNSEQLLPAPMPQGEGKIFCNSGLFLVFSDSLCSSWGSAVSLCQLGVATAVCSRNMRKIPLGVLGRHLFILKIKQPHADS